MKKISKFIYFFSFLMLSLLPSLAFAGPFDPPGSDKSMQIIVKELFGPIVPGGAGASPLSDVVAAFNVAVLIVGGILVAYTLVAGTMSTAHDGEVLGKRWSSLWVPVRTALGVAAVLPVKAGFCFAQIVVVWLAVQGVGIADTVWRAYLDKTANEATTYVPPSANVVIRSLIVEMMKSQACVLAGNEKISKTLDPDSIYLKKEGISKVAGIKYGDTGGCGWIKLQKPPTETGVKIEGELEQFFNMQVFESRMYPVQAAQLSAADAAMLPWTQKIVDSNDPSGTLTAEVNAAIDAQVQKWTLALQNEAKSAYKAATGDNFMKAIGDEGWLMAGMWYVKFAKAQDAVARGVTSVPVTGNSYSRLDATFEVGVFDAIAVAAAVKRVEDIGSKNIDKSGNLIDASGKADGSWSSKFVSFFINDDMRFFSDFGKNAQLNQNPVLMAANLGSNMSSWGWAAYWAGVALLGASSVEGSVFGIGGSLGSGFSTAVSPMLTALAGTVIVAGTTLSTYVPMLPYILWIGVAFGWAVLLVEAVIAAPLWAVTHLAPDGDGVVGRGGQGYMLVLSLTLRPALMIIGFVAAITLMKPLGYLINSTFAGAFITNVSPSIISVVQIITGCVIYTILMISVITRIFALIHVIPDRLLRWIGGGGSNDLGQEAHGIESNTAAKAVAGVHAAQTISNSAQQGMQNARNLSAQERGKLATDASTAAQRASTRADQADRMNKGFESQLQNYQNAGRSGQATEADDAQTQESANLNAVAASGKAAGYAEAAVVQGRSAERSGRQSSPEAEQKRQEQIQQGRSAAAFLERYKKSGADSGSPNDVRNFLQSEASRSAHRGGPRGDWELAAAQGASTLNRADNAINSIREARNSKADPAIQSSDSGQGGGNSDGDGDDHPTTPNGGNTPGGNGGGNAGGPAIGANGAGGGEGMDGSVNARSNEVSLRGGTKNSGGTSPGGTAPTSSSAPAQGNRQTTGRTSPSTPASSPSVSSQESSIPQTRQSGSVQSSSGPIVQDSEEHIRRTRMDASPDNDTDINSGRGR